MAYVGNAPLVVPEGGTGLVTATTAYAPICAGTTATGALQVASTGLSNSGYVLTSNGSAALPSFQAAGGGSLTGITDSGTPFTTALGSGAATSATGINATAVGFNALNALTTGTNNTAVGYHGLSSITTGISNTAIGSLALNLQTAGSNNAAFGTVSLANLLTGENNLGFGTATGYAYTGAETGNICIGTWCEGVVGESRVLRIGQGFSVVPDIAKAYIAGIFGVTTSDAGSSTPVLIDNSFNLGTVASSSRFKENICPMNDESSFIYDLNPVTFNYISDDKKTLQYGLIAEEVEVVKPGMITHNKDGDIQSVHYEYLPTLLLAEIQKLNKRIEALESR